MARTTKKATPAKSPAAETQAVHRRRARPFPPLAFPETLVLGNAIQRHAAGSKVRRLVLFDDMGLPAESMAARTLITASNQYKITKGAYNAEFLELTADGQLATAEGSPADERLRALVRLAIDNNTWFKSLHETFRDNRLPSTAVLEDHLRRNGLDDEFVTDCVSTFIVNAKGLGLLKVVAGAERLLTLDHVLETLAETPVDRTGKGLGAEQLGSLVAAAPVSAGPTPAITGSLDDVCFYLSPIGDDDSDERRHADLFMEALVAPALTASGLRLVRADKIGEAGLITKQIIEHIVRSKLVIADLSFHNPNVFYELALRHAMRKPIVQIIRQSDRIPFDLNQFRTIIIDNTDIYSLVPQLDTYRAEILNQIRTALESTSEGDNPLTAFYPNFWKAMGVS